MSTIRTHYINVSKDVRIRGYFSQPKAGQRFKESAKYCPVETLSCIVWEVKRLLIVTLYY